MSAKLSPPSAADAVTIAATASSFTARLAPIPSSSLKSSTGGTYAASPLWRSSLRCGCGRRRRFPPSAVVLLRGNTNLRSTPPREDNSFKVAAFLVAAAVVVSADPASIVVVAPPTSSSSEKVISCIPSALLEPLMPESLRRRPMISMTGSSSLSSAAVAALPSSTSIASSATASSSSPSTSVSFPSPPPSSASVPSSSPTSLASNSALQSGHVGLLSVSQGRMHSLWKACLQGRTRSMSPSL
mmetsp:Transcript_15528/g.31784  ORF Transcript_15528/g.31784 Transcript_15528/m.31784 type:complete len:243 (-) Transcript_15528:96-824(-)